MLRDPYYVGIVTFRGVQYEGSHPKLVTPELFEQVQQVLTAHAVPASSSGSTSTTSRARSTAGSAGGG